MRSKAWSVKLFCVGILLLSQTAEVFSQKIYPEIPESISLGTLKNIFQPVNFPHLKHAHMSEMGVGCITCHHYADDDIYDPCADCHTNNPDDLESGVPSLNAAFHRKCLSCHREWNASNVCGTCHMKQDDPPAQVISGDVLEKRVIHYPSVVNFQTPLAKKSRVAFPHAEHVELFRFDCATCHQDENCKTCHGPQERSEAIEGDLSVHHFPCSQCHETNLEAGCEKCHRNEPSKGFSHTTSTTFPLKAFHLKQKCTACHDPNTSVKKLDKTCTNCHQNFELGSFNHEATGLVLELGHEEFDCVECHLDNRFDQPPSCYECHEDEMKYPTDLPGYRLD